MLAADANTKARATIESWVKDRISDFTTMVNDQLLTPDEKARLTQDGRKYAMGITYKTYSSPGYVSYVFSMYEDTGGAHPNSTFGTLTFNTNGDKIELADLFTLGARYLDALSKASYNSVVAQLKNRFGPTVDDNQLDWIRRGTEPSSETLQFFYLSNGNLVLLFPPYQVASYAAGTFETPIPLASLSDILRK